MQRFKCKLLNWNELYDLPLGKFGSLGVFTLWPTERRGMGHGVLVVAKAGMLSGFPPFRQEQGTQRRDGRGAWWVFDGCFQ
jgi:hypothetical protein